MIQINLGKLSTCHVLANVFFQIIYCQNVANALQKHTGPSQLTQRGFADIFATIITSLQGCM